ncbi:hypothetical protein II941_02985 [bacterium]|nr:hypothetical protein [bacterium]
MAKEITKQEAKEAKSTTYVSKEEYNQLKLQVKELQLTVHNLELAVATLNDKIYDLEVEDDSVDELDDLEDDGD